LVSIAGIVLLAGIVTVAVDKWPHQDKVVVIGDSMALLAADQLRGTGDSAGYDVEVDGRAGVELSARVDAIRHAVASGADRLVIELGTNDVLANVPADSLDALVDQTVNDVVSVRCVVFVNVGLLTGPTDLAAHFNERLRITVVPHTNQHVFDWSSTYQRHPNWTADGVHVQEPFLSFYAQGIIDAVNDACP